MLRLHFARLLVLLTVVTAGCVPTGPKTFTLTGAVTYEGEPVTDGSITFVSLDPSISDDAAMFDKEGKFTAQVKAGKKKIVIYGTKEGPNIDPVMNAKPKVPYLPQEYSSEYYSKLEWDVTGDAKRDFHLTKP